MKALRCSPSARLVALNSATSISHLPRMCCAASLSRRTSGKLSENHCPASTLHPVDLPAPCSRKRRFSDREARRRNRRGGRSSGRLPRARRRLPGLAEPHFGGSEGEVPRPPGMPVAEDVALRPARLDDQIHAANLAVWTSRRASLGTVFSTALAVSRLDMCSLR